MWDPACLPATTRVEAAAPSVPHLLQTRPPVRPGAAKWSRVMPGGPAPIRWPWAVNCLEAADWIRQHSEVRPPPEVGRGIERSARR